MTTSLYMYGCIWVEQLVGRCATSHIDSLDFKLGDVSAPSEMFGYCLCACIYFETVKMATAMIHVCGVCNHFGTP